MTLIFIIAGLVLLVFGGDYLVKGASGLALKFSMPPMLVGLTVVALGTSAPELVVSVEAALGGKSDISVGNVVGSNIANIGLILAITTLIFPIAIRKEAIQSDWVAMILATAAFYFLALSGIFTRWNGIIFVSLLVGYIVFSFFRAKKKATAEVPEDLKEAKKQKLIVLLLYVGFGITGLIYGARWFLEGAETVARNFGISDRVIAITMVAFGTSVPELAASIAAALKKEDEIFLGNIIGSNLFNLLAIIGITSIIKPITVAEEMVRFDFLWMIGFSVILLPMALIGKKLNRIDGLILLVGYVLYTYLLLFNS